MDYDQLWDYVNIDLPAMGTPYRPDLELTPKERVLHYLRNVVNTGK
jgi:hypothetical protein